MVKRAKHPKPEKEQATYDVVSGEAHRGELKSSTFSPGANDTVLVTFPCGRSVEVQDMKWTTFNNKLQRKERAAGAASDDTNYKMLSELVTVPKATVFALKTQRGKRVAVIKKINNKGKKELVGQIDINSFEANVSASIIQRMLEKVSKRKVCPDTFKDRMNNNNKLQQRQRQR